MEKKRQKSKAGGVETLTLFDSVTTVVVDFDTKKEGFKGVTLSKTPATHKGKEGGSYRDPVFSHQPVQAVPFGFSLTCYCCWCCCAAAVVAGVAFFHAMMCVCV